ncbi:MAG: hypothetical protein IKL28_08345 [Lachnospiraceae bacterium]|nr:hypothetical protein [Lachnospiraceae bacterium]
MNKEDKVKEYVQSTYEELHAPEGLRRKVMNMTEMKAKKTGMSLGKKLAMAAAIAAVLFAGSNGVAYAMTGSTWVENVVARISVNGVWKDVEMEGVVLEDGTVQYSTTLDVQDEDSLEIVLISDATDADSLKISAGDGVGSAFPEVYIDLDDSFTVESNIGVIKEDNKVYFVDGDIKIDITENMADGAASVSYEKNGETYQYEVKEEPGVPGGYELHNSREE